MINEWIAIYQNYPTGSQLAVIAAVFWTAAAATNSRQMAYLGAATLCVMLSVAIAKIDENSYKLKRMEASITKAMKKINKAF